MISFESAKREIAKDPSIILVDVRSEMEHLAQNIEGSVLLPTTRIESLAPALIPDKNSRVFVYCQSGVRSASSAKKLKQMGYSQVEDIGGISNWGVRI